MGGANNRSLISAHFCISAYFLTAETYKRMRLTTRVYGILVLYTSVIVPIYTSDVSTFHNNVIASLFQT